MIFAKYCRASLCQFKVLDVRGEGTWMYPRGVTEHGCE